MSWPKVASNSQASISWTPLLFWIFLLLYSSFILYRPHFGLIDDARVLETYLAGKPLPPYITPSDGRFAPLQGEDYVVLLFLHPTALSFFAINALELVVIGWLFVGQGSLALGGRRSALPYAFAACVMLTPGFIEVWLRLFVPERTEIVLFSLLFICFLKFHNSQKGRYALPCLIAAIMALCCKETAFILVGGIGLFHLCLNRSSTFKSRSLDIVLIALSAIWLTFYYCFIYRFHGPTLYSASSGKPLYAVLHTLASNTLHDPWIIVCLFLLLFFRFHSIIQNHKINPIFDSVLLSCFFFYFAYFLLRMSNIYYLLPLYVFVPYSGCTILQNPSLRRLFHPALLTILSIMFFTQFLSGLREDLTWKFAPANFQASLNAILLEHTQSHKAIHLFLSGASRGSGIELYSNLATYIIHSGLRPDQFDILSDSTVDQPLTYKRFLNRPEYPFSYRNPGEIDKPVSGDYILLTPYDSIYHRSIFRDSVKYTLVFKTNTHIVRDLSLKQIASRLFPHLAKDTDDGIIDTNYYLYKVL
jgi:hypothetical protein